MSNLSGLGVSEMIMPELITADHGAADNSRPLVVLLHGRGSNERDIIGLAPYLPTGLEYRAVRAPIAEGGGYAWFANQGIGRPLPQSLRATMTWFQTWLDQAVAADRPVILVGFSGGAAFAGGLILDQPQRYAGAAILHGTLPFTGELPITPGRLANLPVFVGQGDSDQVIPLELQASTWAYLQGPSGAPMTGHRDPGGHGLTAGTVQALAEWTAYRVAQLEGHGRVPSGLPADVRWPLLPGERLAPRAGGRPDVAWRIPQQQLTQNSPAKLRNQLLDLVSALPDVNTGPSAISVPGAQAFTLNDPRGPVEAFLGARCARVRPSASRVRRFAAPGAPASPGRRPGGQGLG